MKELSKEELDKLKKEHEGCLTELEWKGKRVILGKPNRAVYSKAMALQMQFKPLESAEVIIQMCAIAEYSDKDLLQDDDFKASSAWQAIAHVEDQELKVKKL